MRPTDARFDPPRGLLVLAPQPFLEDRGTPLALREVLRALTKLGETLDARLALLDEPGEPTWEHFVASVREVYQPILGSGRPSREPAPAAS